jgi:hypothetical protein
MSKPKDEAPFACEPDKNLFADGLISLSKALGDQFPYLTGVPFQNSVFTFHPACSCGKNSCPWCSECSCPDSAYHYIIEKQKVSRAAYMATWWSRYELALHRGDNRTIAAAKASDGLDILADKVCNFCRKGFPKYGGLPGWNAPNFYYPAFGIRAYWGTNLLGNIQVYIGEKLIDQRYIPTARIVEMFSRCEGSLKKEKKDE